jgi:OmpA-OmpF porin, OOP family
LPVLDNLGQAMAQDPNLNIQINGTEQMPAMAQSTVENSSAAPTEGAPTESAPAEELVKQKVEKMKAYLVQKFHVKVDRIVTGVNNKIKVKADTLQNSKTGSAVKGFLTQIVKL